MKRNVPRLQHYVPQLLLRRFAQADGKLWAYDSLNQKIFRTSPKGLAAEGGFYGTPEIERWLAKEIEGPGAAALDLLLAKRELSAKEIQAFFAFVAAQMQRTPASLQRATDSLTPELQETAERMAKFAPEVRSNIIADAKAAGNTDAEISELIQLLDEGAFTITPTREFAIEIGFDVLEPLVAELAKMCWTFLDVHSTDGDLIVGDHPVTLTDVAPDGILAGPLGVKNPNIEIVMPLSPRVVALAHWNGPISYGELAPGMATELNERALRNAYRFSYARFESKELLARAISLRGTGPKMRTRKFRIGEKLFMVNEFR